MFRTVICDVRITTSLYWPCSGHWLLMSGTDDGKLNYDVIMWSCTSIPHLVKVEIGYVIIFGSPNPFMCLYMSKASKLQALTSVIYNAATPLIKLIFLFVSLVHSGNISWIHLLVFLSVSLCVSCVVSMCVYVSLMCGTCLSLGSYVVAAIV